MEQAVCQFLRAYVPKSQDTFPQQSKRGKHQTECHFSMMIMLPNYKKCPTVLLQPTELSPMYDQEKKEETYFYYFYELPTLC